MSNKERPSALEEKKFRAEFDEQSNEESLRHRRECSDSSVYEGPEPRKKTRNTRKIQIAVAGCSHGEMDKIYAALSEIERQRSIKFDLLISCGDYQAVRNYGDLKHMHVKEKFRDLQTFYRYYSGDVVSHESVFF
ncbi:hypothetical protein AB6A40_010516 [Gnathostoma spinigerum]|uniref:Calcineurin-like phosphoesterase domain-containing protein n=1 Tax=Gnathostoma spinigerum TaxID=75299 RepID=A0ABD6F2K9_9BILA